VSLPGLLIHEATLWRRPDPAAYRDGIPTRQPFQAIDTFPCRLDYNDGQERVSAQSDIRALSRTATLFVGPEGPAITHLDRVTVDAQPGLTFEVVDPRPQWGFGALSHYEIALERVEGS
jgi:hypothetical protein